MPDHITLRVNGREYRLQHIDPETPLLYVLRNDLNLYGPKFGCGLEQCNACKVLIDGADVPSCQLPVKNAQDVDIMTLEGLGTQDALHPLQEAFLEEQAAQCGYCTAGMIIAAQGLLNRIRYPTDDDINAALADNLCRCGTQHRVRRAIKLRIGRPDWNPIYEVREMTDIAAPESSGDLPASLQQFPEIDRWLRIHSDGQIVVFTGKVELGQGIKTALRQIAAEELDVSPSRIRVMTADTGATPDEGLTAGSMSLEVSGNALRIVTAEARHILLDMAFEHLEAETPAPELHVDDGTITDPATGRQVTYWALMGGKSFGRQVTGNLQPKSPTDYRLIGQPEKRIDLLAKVAGVPTYIHDKSMPGMLHGRVVRPPHQHARLVSLDDSAVWQMPGVIAVVRDGSFLGVIAEREEQAIKAAAALREAATWRQIDTLPTSDNIYEAMLSQPAQSVLIVDATPVDDAIPPLTTPPDAAHTLTATYYRPFQMHASIGPSAALAQWENGHLTVQSHTQGAYLLQAALATVFDIAPENVRVVHHEGAGAYGHNGADDAALDAALLARAVPGKPVLLKWMREDEHKWEPYGTAMIHKMQASLNADGVVIAWNHDLWTYPHTTRPRGGEGSGLLAAWHLARPFAKPKAPLLKRPEFGGHRNAQPKYNFPQQRIVKHFIAESAVRTSSLRSLGAYANVFAIESFMDELAQAAGSDPVEFRLRHLTDARAIAVIQAAAEKAEWQTRARPAGEGYGRGIAFAQYKNKQCYTAIVVDLHVDVVSGEIRLQRAVIAADAGQIVNPDGLSNQLEGGFVQAASWTLLEAVTFDESGITSIDWDTYPILHFAGVPKIETVLLNRPHLPFIGAGEATQNPTPAAIANAVYDAVGVRLREIPFTPQRVKAAIEN